MARRILLTFIGAPLLGIAGCASDYTDRGWMPPRPLGSDLPIYRAPQTTTARLPAGDTEPTGVLILRQAMAAALLHNPELASSSYTVRSAEASVLQASLPPNPELGIDVENFGGSGSVEGFETAETTVALSQANELGGKRAKRIQAARLTTDLAGWDYETKRIDVLTEVTQRFIDVAAAQRRVELAKQNVELADQVLNTVAERVKAGKVPPVEQTKSRVLLATNRSALERARPQLLSARQRLAATWGSAQPMFDSVSGDLDTLAAIPTMENLLARLSQNPDLARWSTELALRRAELAVAKSKSIPDLTVSGGLRQFAETDDVGGVVGISIPIPIFDRNQGDIRKSTYDLLKSLSDQQAAATRVRAALEQAYQNLFTAHETAVTWRTEVLPGAEEAFSVINISYSEGKLPYIEVLDAQRTLYEARGQYTDALVEYHKAVAEVERLVGEGLNGRNVETTAQNRASTQETATQKSQEK